MYYWFGFFFFVDYTYKFHSYALSIKVIEKTKKVAKPEVGRGFEKWL